jgi:hypothetical protein
LPALGGEAFEMAQWAAQTSAGAALQQMGVRFAWNIWKHFDSNIRRYVGQCSESLVET